MESLLIYIIIRIFFSHLKASQPAIPKKRGKLFLKQLWDRMNAVVAVVDPEPEEEEEAAPENIVDWNNLDDDEKAFQMVVDLVGKSVTSKKRSSTRKTPSQVIDELKLEKINMSSSVNDYWERLKIIKPDLYSLYEVVFAIPPTQVSVERAFSALRVILTHLRHNLLNDILKDLLLVKLNYDMVDGAFTEEEIDVLLLQKKT